MPLKDILSYNHVDDPDLPLDILLDVFASNALATLALSVREYKVGVTSVAPTCTDLDSLIPWPGL